MTPPTFTAVFNFRDLGGHATGDGRTVRPGRLFRSDSLHRISAGDVEQLASLGVRTVLDLRRPTEIALVGRVPVELGLDYHNVYPVHREWDPAVYDEAAGAHRFLADRYRDMAEEGRAGLGEALRMVADARYAPLVMHCMAGKDRTGVLAALTLSLLGVPDEAVAADYALSELTQGRLSQRLREDGVALDVPMHFMVCPPQAMLLFLTELRTRYGSVLAYAEAAGVTDAHVAALRGHLLQGSAAEPLLP
ncbi:MAG TPA: tyrosine-protein phosphatase [Rugosimonospora sp.]|nr:tyrosine-protein phosphatase [Rugosimonospora sp.]